MLALVNNRPEVLNLKRILRGLLSSIGAKSSCVGLPIELRKAEERAHILEGLKIALDNLDAVIALIRRAQSPDDARAGLMQQFQLTEFSRRHSGDAAAAAHPIGAQQAHRGISRGLEADRVSAIDPGERGAGSYRSSAMN